MTEIRSISRPVPNPDFGVELVRDWDPGAGARATVIVLHGIAEHSGRYERLGSLFAESGFHVRSFDLRGAGASGGRRWDIEDWGLYLDQVERHVSWARSHGRPVVLFGHSLGGTLALGYCLSDHPHPDALVLSAPALEAGARWQRVIAPIMSRLAPTVLLPNRVPAEALSQDPEVGRAYLDDPLVLTSSTPRFGHEFFKAMDRVRQDVSRIRVPTLVIHGGDDRLVTPQSTASLTAFDAIDRRLYPGLRHELHNEPEAPEVVADLVEWIDQHI